MSNEHPCNSLYYEAIDLYNEFENKKSEFWQEYAKLFGWCPGAAVACTLCVGTEGMAEIVKVCTACVLAATTCVSGAENAYDHFEAALEAKEKYESKLEDYNDCMHENKFADEEPADEGEESLGEAELEAWQDPDGLSESEEYAD